MHDDMTPEVLIIALCREAGDTESDEVILEGYDANHRSCCGPDIKAAAQGDVTALIQIRRCMGLPIVS
jgi:hypothetical protein